MTQTPPLGIYETVAQAPLPYFLDLLGHVLTGDASLTSQLQLIEAARSWTSLLGYWAQVNQTSYFLRRGRRYV